MSDNPQIVYMYMKHRWLANHSVADLVYWLQALCRIFCNHRIWLEGLSPDAVSGPARNWQ